MKRSAFSVTELLIVCAIVCILAALLFPIFGRTKEQAKQTACMSNLHQVFVAMKLYQNDFDAYPFSPDPVVLSPLYLKSGLLRCGDQRLKNVKNDYVMSGTRLKTYHYYNEFLSCEEKRGTDFPRVTDRNHLSIENGISLGGRYFLLIREAGNIRRIPLEQFTALVNMASPSPCDILLGSLNL